MVEGLVISENIVLFEEFNINFSNEKNNFEYANSSAAAKDLINMEMPEYLVILENSVDKVQSLLKDLNEEKGIERIPVICMLPAHQWDQRKILWQMGVQDIIALPISKDEFKLQIENFLNPIAEISIDQEEAGMNGKLEDYNLLDLIQILASNKKTGILNLYQAREEGKIWFHEGNIQNAEYRSFEPMEAILKLITWSGGDFSISFSDEIYEKIIEVDTQDILFSAIQHIDDRNRILDTLPERADLLLISPEADMDKINEGKVNLLRYFHGGNTIAGYLDAFDHGDLFLLEILSEFVENKYLMTRSEFDSHITAQDLQSGGAGIKKVFKRFFARKDDKIREPITSPKLNENEQMDEELFKDPQIRQFKHYFSRDKFDFDRILTKVESL